MIDQHDGTLVRATLRGDRDAFAELLRRHEGRVYAVAYAKVLDPHDAADVTQQALMRAYQRLDQLREPRQFRGWLCRIAASCAHDLLRKRSREVVTDIQTEFAETPAPDAAHERSDRDMDARSLLHRALASLPEALRLPVVMRDMDGAAFEDIAECLSITPTNAQTRVWRARDQLRRYLRQAGVERECRELLRTYALPAAIGVDAILGAVGTAKARSSSWGGAEVTQGRIAGALVGGIAVTGVLCGVLGLVAVTWGSVRGEARLHTAPTHATRARQGRQAIQLFEAPPRVRLLIRPGDELLGWVPCEPGNDTTLPVLTTDHYASGGAGAMLSNDFGVRRDFPPVDGVLTIEMWIRPAIGPYNTHINLITGDAGHRWNLIGKNETDRWYYLSSDGLRSHFFADVRDAGHAVRIVYRTADATYDVHLDGVEIARGRSIPNAVGKAATSIAITAGRGGDGAAAYFDDLKITAESS